MTDKKIEPAVSYEDGDEQRKQFEVASFDTDDAISDEHARVDGLVDRVMDYLREDRQRVWRAMADRQIERQRTAQRAATVTTELGVLPDIVAQVARELFTTWLELPETRDIVGLQLVEGYCGAQLHGWFRVRAHPALLGPKFEYVIDPAPRGLRISDPGLVVEPFGTFQLAYDGKVVMEKEADGE